jgi:hypothetical protein
MARNITPDLAIILESQHWNLGDFTGLSGWKIPAAMDLSALPRSGGVLSGGLFLFFTPWTKLAILERLKAAGLLPLQLPPLGSVGLSAVAAALRLTRGPVITAGLDFSFTFDLYHARSTPEHLKRLRCHNRFTPLFNTDYVYGGAAFKTVSRTGDPVFSSPALTHYRNLFEREFSAAAGRLFDITGSGLPLGIKSLSPEEAVNVLSRNKDFTTEKKEKTTNYPLPTTNSLNAFVRDEQDRLILLRNILTGAVPQDNKTLDLLIDECDYLWAHFPDYAASSRRPDHAGISFLKRLRAEIEPFLALFTGLMEK